MSQGDYLMQRRYIFENFRNSYIDEFKALSKKTHECKVKCFEDTKTNRLQVDECSRRCSKPIKKQQELNSQRIFKCEEKFQTGMQMCRTGKVKLNEDMCSKGLLEDYKTCFEAEADNVKANIKMYTDMFDDVVYKSFEEEKKELEDMNKRAKKRSFM